ncbi:uncharacterized protein [Venturia canescens]|uniref:uncharacterized protein n=1 Tax=Venturia canescens TaxID=32260 RepID=UPI001C9D089B|nr:uncharacterized protein LOC122414316 [Venturia canescens]
MNLAKRFCLLEKLFGTLKKYTTLTTASLLVEKRDAHVKNLLRTRICDFLKKNGKINDYDENSKMNAQIAETSNGINDSNLFKTYSLQYNNLVALLEAYVRKERSDGKEYYLSTIDDEYCKLLGVLTVSQIFHLLHLLMKTGSNITLLKSYKSSLLALRKYLERDCLSKEEKLQLLFFEGLSKRPARKYVKSLLNTLPPFQDLSFMEKIVVAHTTFQCSVRLDLQDTRLLEEHLENNVKELIEDPPILSTICKALSYAGMSEKFSLDNLDREILNSPKKISITNAGHLLSFYVQANHLNSEIVQRLVCDSMAQIIEDRNRKKWVRIKDFDNIVRALSWLNHRLNEVHKEELALFVSRRYREFTESPHLLINTLLALWTLDCRLHEIIDKGLSDGTFELVKQETKFWKRVARLHLLLVCIKIEAPETNLPSELFEFPEVGLEILKPVKKLCKLIKELDNKLEMNEIRIDCPVEAMYIPGVSFERKQMSFHLDLLNKTTCFKSTEVPHGLMNLKLRLLEKIGYTSILIPEDKSTDADFVLSEIKKSVEKNTVVKSVVKLEPRLMEKS